MINPFNEINWRPAAADLRKFAWSLVFGFPCIAIVFFLGRWMAGRAIPEPRFFLMLGGIGASVGLVCWLAPFIARPLYYVWYAFAACIGLVMANLLFALLFYGVFTPLGLLMRLPGRNALNLKSQKQAATHWTDAPPARPAAQYFNQH